MEKCGILLKSALVAIVVMAVVQSGSAAEKLASCCKTVNRQEITEPVLNYLIQTADPPCVRAVIFQTKTGLFCSYHKAPWVKSKIIAIEKAKAQAAAASSVVPSSPVSLLSIITSTASPPSSSSSSSPSYTSQEPTGETSSTSSQ